MRKSSEALESSLNKSTKSPTFLSCFEILNHVYEHRIFACDIVHINLMEELF